MSGQWRIGSIPLSWPAAYPHTPGGHVYGNSAVPAEECKTLGWFRSNVGPTLTALGWHWIDTPQLACGVSTHTRRACLRQLSSPSRRMQDIGVVPVQCRPNAYSVGPTLDRRLYADTSYSAISYTACKQYTPRRQHNKHLELTLWHPNQNKHKYQHDIHYTGAQLMITLRLLERWLGYFNTLVALKRILKQRSYFWIFIIPILPYSFFGTLAIKSIQISS